MSVHGSLLSAFSTRGEHVQPPTSWRRRLRHFLIIVATVASAILLGSFGLAFGPRFLGYSTFVVHGGSMEPAISVGSVAVAKPAAAADLRVGDIIAYKPSRAPTATIHRVIAVEGAAGSPRLFTLKGDANLTADPVPVALEGRGSRVIYSVPKIGYAAAFARTGRGRVLLLWLPAFGLAGLTLWEIWAPRRPQG